MDTGQGLNQQYTFSGSVYFDRMTKRGMYTTNVDDIRQRVERLGLTNIFQRNYNIEPTGCFIPILKLFGIQAW